MIRKFIHAEASAPPGQRISRQNSSPSLPHCQVLVRLPSGGCRLEGGFLISCGQVAPQSSEALVLNTWPPLSFVQGSQGPVSAACHYTAQSRTNSGTNCHSWGYFQGAPSTSELTSASLTLRHCLFPTHPASRFLQNFPILDRSCHWNSKFSWQVGKTLSPLSMSCGFCFTSTEHLLGPAFLESERPWRYKYLHVSGKCFQMKSLPIPWTHPDWLPSSQEADRVKRT